MISYQLTRYGQPLELVQTDRPDPVGTEVLVQIEACGVCHSDLHLWDGFFNMGGGKRLDLSKGRELPLTLGHEIAGTVVALGADAGGVEVGAPRVVYPWIGCGGCSTCQAGQEHLCAQSRALGVSRHGGFSDHVLVPHPRYLFEFGDRPASLACTYACSGLTAFSAVRKVQSRVDGQPLVIIGLGGVGFAGLRLAQAVTSASIVAVDVDDATLQAAADTGATVVDARADDAAKQNPAAHGRRCPGGHRLRRGRDHRLPRVPLAGHRRCARGCRAVRRAAPRAAAIAALAQSDDTGLLCRQPRGDARFDGPGPDRYGVGDPGACQTTW